MIGSAHDLATDDLGRGEIGEGRLEHVFLLGYDMSFSVLIHYNDIRESLT